MLTNDQFKKIARTSESGAEMINHALVWSGIAYTEEQKEKMTTLIKDIIRSERLDAVAKYYEYMVKSNY